VPATDRRPVDRQDPVCGDGADQPGSA
jgi:hypothetical protein